NRRQRSIAERLIDHGYVEACVTHGVGPVDLVALEPLVAPLLNGDLGIPRRHVRAADNRGGLPVQPALCVDLAAAPLAVFRSLIIDVAGTPAVALAIDGRLGAVSLEPPVLYTAAAVTSLRHHPRPLASGAKPSAWFLSASRAASLIAIASRSTSASVWA